MRRSLALAGLTFVALAPNSPSARADDRPLLQRIVERTPCPRIPLEHSMARAGYPLAVSPHAVPSLTRFDNAGYIGGGSLKGNDLLARGPGSATGPVCDGTFGTDFTGFRQHLGRVFLAPSVDPSRGPSFQKLYNADGPRVVDVLALRPLRKAVLEKREDSEHRRHGGEGHGAEGHGKEGHKGEGNSGERQ
ncbi:MAG: hypothetical protein ACKODX_04820 [Gemmata sp.]